MIREYELVSNKCGVIDLSWRGKIEVVFFLFTSTSLLSSYHCKSEESSEILKQNSDVNF